MNTTNRKLPIDKKFLLTAGVIAAACLIAVCAFVTAGGEPPETTPMS